MSGASPGSSCPIGRRLVLIIATVVAAALVGLAPALLVRGIIDSAIAGSDQSLLLWLSVGLFTAAVALGLIGVLRSYLNTVVSQRIMYDLKLRMFSRLQSLSLRFYTEARTGELMSRLTSDIAGIDTIVSGTLVTISQERPDPDHDAGNHDRSRLAADGRLAHGAAVADHTDADGGKMRRRLRMQRQQMSASVNSLMAESLGISGLMLIKTFTREREVLGRFQRENWDLMQLQVREALVGRWYFMLLFIVTTGGPAVIFWFGGGQVISGSLTIGTVVAFVALLSRLYTPATDLMSLHVDVVTSAAYFERIFEYLDLEPDIADAPGAVALGSVAGALTFEDVVLEYTPGRRALDGMDFAVKPGELVALVGPSGAGKTTTTYLIPRLYDPTEGRVLLDGVDIRGLMLESLREQVGYVSQETFLFHDTVAVNLRVARPDASHAEMVEACRAASVLDVVGGCRKGSTRWLASEATGYRGVRSSDWR